MADGRDVEKSVLKSMPGRKGKNPGAQKPEWQIRSRCRATNLSMRRHVGGQVRTYVYMYMKEMKFVWNAQQTEGQGERNLL